MQRDRFSFVTSFTLKQPEDPKPEPAPETATRDRAEGASGPLRDRIIEVAESTLTSKTGFSRYASYADASTRGELMPQSGRSDCSEWVQAVYLKADADDPGGSTWEQPRQGKRTGRPKPGDLMMSASTGHVELVVEPGSGETIGHGSPPIDYANVSAWPGHCFVTFDFLDGD